MYHLSNILKFGKNKPKFANQWIFEECFFNVQKGENRNIMI